MQKNKPLDLMVMVDYQLDMTKLLTAMLPKESVYAKYIKRLDICVGKFEWYGDVMTELP
jgi:hypothetical protein